MSLYALLVAIYSTPIHAVNTSVVLSDNYFVLPNRWVGDDSGYAAGTQPSVDGRRYLNLNIDHSPNGWIKDDVMLQICDGRTDCDFVSSHYYVATEIEFFRRDPDKTAYIHKYRCPDGLTASNITAPLTGGLYKECDDTFDAPSAMATFKLPPFLCQQSCDQNTACMMFTTNAAGDTCWLSHFETTSGVKLYVKVAV